MKVFGLISLILILSMFSLILSTPKSKRKNYLRPVIRKSNQEVFKRIGTYCNQILKTELGRKYNKEMCDKVYKRLNELNKLNKTQ